MTQYRTHLKAHERDLIAHHHAIGLTPREIADQIGRSVRTIYRELTRGREPGEPYLSSLAHELAQERRRPANGSPVKLSTPDGLLLAEELLVLMRTQRRSVDQALKIVAKTGKYAFTVTRQTAYRWLYNSGSATAYKMCQAMIHPRFYSKRTSKNRRKSKYQNMVMHNERPQGCLLRSEAGHLEGDLIVGKNSKTVLITLVDRKTRFCVILPPKSASANDVTWALKAWVERQPADAVKSITWDQGNEAAYHEWFTRLTGVPFFFADAHSPWQRGSNENLNGVIRRHFPKSTVLPRDAATTASVAGLLNERPMSVLSGLSPAESNASLGGASLQI